MFVPLVVCQKEKKHVSIFLRRKKNLGNREICLTGDDVNHIKKCSADAPGRRSDGFFRKGNGLSLPDPDFGKGLYLAGCFGRSAGGDGIAGEDCPFQALPKKDKMEWIIQKAVELGAAEIVPVSSRRCVVRLDDKKKRKETGPLADHCRGGGQAERQRENS